MATNPAFQTEFANRAYIVANVFNKKFQTTEFTGKAPRVVLVMPSTEASTEGGKLARATINLKAYTGTTSPPLNAGWFDVGNDTATLNRFEAVFDLHLGRGGSKSDFHLDRAQYDQFLEDAKKFLEGEKFKVGFKEGKPVPAGGGARNIGLILVTLMAIAAAVGGAALYFLKGA